jgi:hypothetical protein
MSHFIGSHFYTGSYSWQAAFQLVLDEQKKPCAPQPAPLPPAMLFVFFQRDSSPDRARCFDCGAGMS